MSEMRVPAFGSLALRHRIADIQSGATRREPWLDGAIDGSPEALEALVRDVWPTAYAVALGILGRPAAAEDIAQEAVLAAMAGLPAFERARPFRPWLHRITVNRALDQLRIDRRRGEQALDGVRHNQRSAPSDGLNDDLLAALSGLEPRDRALVLLRHVAGFNATELAEMLDMSPTGVRSALARSLTWLRRELALEDPEDGESNG
jgi:RNA polymerase sigma-70 factor (ECF subfamily)